MTRQKFAYLKMGLLSLLAAAGTARAEFPKEPTTPVRLEISENTVVRTEDSRAGQPLLVTESTLPSGSIVEITSTLLENPKSMSWWKGSSVRSPIEFVRGIRIISAPGLSQKEIDDLNRINAEDGLFMAKSQLEKGKPVETVSDEIDEGDDDINSEAKIDAKDVNLRKVTLNEPSTTYFDQVNMGKGVGRGSHTPNAAARKPPERLTLPDAELALAKVREANQAVREVGEINPAEERCEIEDVMKKALDAGISERALKNALRYYNNNKASITNQRYITIVDFTMPSTEKRMFIIDTTNGQVTRHLAAHGIGSDGGKGKIDFDQMSNRDGSHATPPGFHLAAETYHGKYGYSLRLDGQESRNSNSRARAVVLHPADYATPAFIKANGYLGRSWGCPAVDPRESKQIIDRIKGGSLFYHYNGE